VPRYISEKTKAKHLGMKTGKGIFDYTPEKAQQLRAARAAKLVAVRKAMQS
jgi:5-formyl-3-hydroxy-2-methylpyridine 4-carboxylate dehydrogenase